MGNSSQEGKPFSSSCQGRYFRLKFAGLFHCRLPGYRKSCEKLVLV